jgi:hypothetical protein
MRRIRDGSIEVALLLGHRAGASVAGAALHLWCCSRQGGRVGAVTAEMPSSMQEIQANVRHGLRVDALGKCCAFGQMCGVLGTVGVMHLEADDLAAVEIEDDPAP